MISCVNGALGAAAVAQETADANRPIRDKWALVVGISNFENPKLNLRYSAKDASDFADYLTKNAGFAPDHVKILLNKDATQRRILSELGNKWLPHVANPDDLVVIFLSTHGSGAEMDIGGQNYLVAYDTDIDDLYTTAIPMQRLAHDIKSRVHCDRVVIFLDACHSGATENGGKGLIRTGVDANELSSGSGQLVIASSKEDQISWESKKLANGVFTAILLDSLKRNGASMPIGKMFAGLKDDVQDTVLRERGTLQTPVMKSQWSGNDILIAGRPTAPRPGYDEDKGSVETPAIAVAEPTPVSPAAPTPSPPPIEYRMNASFKPPTDVPSTSSFKPPTDVPSTSSFRPPTLADVPTIASFKPPTSTGVPTTASFKPPTSTATKSSSQKPEHKKIAVPPPPSSAVPSAEPVNPRILLVPGQSVARMHLGMSKPEVLNLLGKPTLSSDDVITYWTSDRSYFLSVLLKAGVVSEIAFNSPAFKTANEISLSNYTSRMDQFSKPTNSIVTLAGGGLSIVNTGNNSPIGVVFTKRTTQAPVGWWDSHSNPPPKPSRASAN